MCRAGAGLLSRVSYVHEFEESGDRVEDRALYRDHLC